MDDFRVGSVPSPEPYGDRHPYGAGGRKRPKHHSEDGGPQEEEPADTFEAGSTEEEPSAAADGEVEDYYVPSEPAGDDE